NMDTASAAGWGLDYKNTITHKTVALLARVDSQPVMVFIDLASKDKGQPAPTNPALHMFKRIVGPYVLYELTPLDSPKVENDLYIQ
ncbi:MAG TPA: hypothetical protein VG711_09290, partial [Phycisphaerales bacterium]|nr:hypothetical protein [Phycisphaerales bacterium]